MLLQSYNFSAVRPNNLKEKCAGKRKLVIYDVILSKKHGKVGFIV